MTAKSGTFLISEPVFVATRGKSAVVSLVALFCLLVVPPSCGAKKTVPQPVVLDGGSLGPVTFTHQTHDAYAATDCTTCHHQNDFPQPQPCRDCHKKKRETTEGSPPSFWEVKMTFCRGCHQKAIEERDRSEAPVHCIDCHDVTKISG